MSTPTTPDAQPDPAALGHDSEPTDLAARVIDRDGDQWARRFPWHQWGCLTTSSAPQDWRDLVNVCGPLRLAEHVATAQATALAQAQDPAREAWVCDGCMMRVYSHQIADFVDGEHVLCKWCDRNERAALTPRDADEVTT